jgi:hypothetical protein
MRVEHGKAPPPAPSCLKSVFDRMARWTERQAGRSLSFVTAACLVLIWAISGPFFRLVGHLATGHQHRYDNRYLPDGIPDPERA